MFRDKITKKDLLLLQELDKNARQSYSQLAKKTKINKETTKYRIQRLQEKNILKGFWLIPTPNLGFILHKILIKNTSLGNTEALIKFLQQKAVSWFAETEGSKDFAITTLTNDMVEFKEFYIEFQKKFGKYFGQKELILCTKILEMNEKYLYEKGQLTYSLDLPLFQKTIQLDETDQKIIQELSNDGRMSLVEISKKTNKTPEAVAKRYKNLEKQGIIKKIKPRINFQKLGLNYYHLILEVKDANDIEQIINYYKAHYACISLMTYIGNYDLHLEFITKKESLNEILEDLRNKFGEKLNKHELLRITKEHRIKIL